jgi:DNA-binding PadR family transcriptional regulator
MLQLNMPQLPPVESLLPLPPHVFEILLALTDRDLHGYALLQAVSRQSEGRVALGTSTMYAALKRMRGLALVEEVDAPGDADSQDPRRKYYRLTPFGQSAARAEAERIRRLNRLITASRVLDRPTGAQES